MTHRTRTILFLVLLILFLIAAPLIVFYCLGWRFDWQTKKLYQPGMFYFKAWPKNCQVYIDGQPKKKTDFFFGSVLIENLPPKKYDVEIKKEQFHSWRKILEAKKGEVTEVKNIVLIPENLDFKEITKGVKDFFFSPDEKKIILKEEEKLSSGKIIWSLKLFEIDKNVKSQLINEGNISKENAELLDLKFSPDSKKILLEIGLKERVDYYLLDIDKTPLIITPLGSLEKPEEFFLASPLGKEAIAFAVFDKNIYYLDPNGFLFQNEKKLNIIPFPLKQETNYEITASGSNILLQEGDILYIFDQNTSSFQKLSHIKNFRFSPDSQKLAYFSDYEIWVLFLEKKYDQPQKEAGDQLFITRFSEKIDNVFWYTNHYLIFNVGDKIKVAELDDRDKINIVDLAEFSSVAKSYGGSSEAFGEEGKNPKIFWSNKKLYLLSEENLYVSAELTP